MQYKIKIAAHPVEQAVTLLLDGSFSGEALADLHHSVSVAKETHQRVYIDLSEVTLVDREAVRYLSEQARQDVRLVNCPTYLRSWIDQNIEDKEN